MEANRKDTFPLYLGNTDECRSYYGEGGAEGVQDGEHMYTHG